MHGIANPVRALAFIIPALLSSPAGIKAMTPALTAALPGFELNFTKGDTREGSQVRIRVAGDSLHYSRTDFAPGRDAARSFRSEPLDSRRKLALKRILGELPRFQVFGSCFGKGMRYYLIDTPGGRFYRSLPERSGRCFTDEPGIWPLLDDLDTFMTPPEEGEDPDYSAADEGPKS